MRILLGSIALIVVVCGVSVAEYELVADARPETFPGSSQPTGFLEIGGRYFFVATTPVEGRQIWVTDLSEDGTLPLTAGNEGNRVTHLASLGDRVIYLQHVPQPVGEEEFELWSVSGEPGSAIRVGVYDGVADSVFTFNGWVWFFVTNESAGLRHIWRTDGDSVETFLTASKINDLRDDVFAVLPSEFLFAWYSDAEGVELWHSDGTKAGTSIVIDRTPGPGGSFPRPGSGGVVGDVLVYLEDAGVGYRVVRSDGTAAGTVAISETLYHPNRIVSAGDYAYFWSVDSLWQVPSNAGAPRQLTIDGLARFHSGLVPFRSGVLLFGVGEDGRSGVWSVETEPGLNERILDWPDTNGFSGGVSIGDRVLISVFDPDGPTLFSTDGTAAATVPVGATELEPSTQLFGFDGIALFAADDGAVGSEPWVSDGTVAGTHLVANLAPDVVTPESRPGELTWIGDSLVFGASNSRREIWRWSEALGLDLLHYVDTSFSIQVEITAFEGYAVFSDPPSLLRIAPAGGQAEPIFRSTSQRGPSSVSVQRGDLFFAAGSSFYLADPDLDGARRLGPAYHPGRGVGVVGGNLVYAADMNEFGEEVWVSDGTENGTFLLEDTAPGEEGSRPNAFTSISGGVLFGTTVENVWKLWWTDASPKSPVLLLEVEVDGPTFGPEEMHPAGGGAYFFVDSGLWWSDGTSSGTKLIRAFPEPSGMGGTSANMSDVGDGRTIVFGLLTPDLGGEVWITDGTTEGTRLVRDLVPGAASSQPREFVTDGRVVYFLATTPELGDEIFVTNGTPEGTDLAFSEFRPGRLSARSHSLSLRPDYLYFVGDDGLSGLEVWRVGLPRSVCAADCNSDGRVTIAELITAVRIALGVDIAESCLAADANGDNRVTIAELIAGVTASLDGC